MTVCDAVARRVEALLVKMNMSLYHLEQNSGIQHGSMECIIKRRNKTVTLSTVMMLARGFGITVTQFLDDDLFNGEELEIE